jgi:phosphoadenosine phosphosulfate reductase
LSALPNQALDVFARSEEMTATEVLEKAISLYGPRFGVLTSFQREGMVIVDMAARIDPKVRVMTLDTGRLPAATYDIMEQVRGRYGIAIEIVSPDGGELEAMVSKHGPNLFYESLAHRRLCCHFRKVRPLDAKLQGVDCYAVGLRRGQSEGRSEVEKVAQGDRLLKLSPLADWSSAQVEDYIRANNVPVHPLYAQGYTSIGCDPCTRATSAGEDERAGRWWWEQGSNKECGLHFSADGRVERSVDVLIREILLDRNA